jgi:hypothetical protein
MSVHLDEGYIDTDGIQCSCDRQPDGFKNRVISLDRKQLAAVQDLTAETLQMERAHWPKDREDAVASMFHTVNLGLRQMQPD